MKEIDYVCHHIQKRHACETLVVAHGFLGNSLQTF